MRQGVRAEKQEQRLLHEGVQEQAERKPMKAKIKYHDGASRIERHGAMWDMAASETVTLRKGEARIIPLGVSVKLPSGYMGVLVPRSSTCLKHGIMMANSVGIIENDYAGNNDVWGFAAYAIRDTVIERGTRIAQFMPVRYAEGIEFEEVESMGCADRGGYGSTGERSAGASAAEGRTFRDANGLELHVGDYVIDESGECFCVMGLNREDGATAAYADLGNSRTSLECAPCKSLELDERPHDCDGVPVEVGDVLYQTTFEGKPIGDPMEVGKHTGNALFVKGLALPINAWSCTHREPDSWENLEEDVRNAAERDVAACAYLSPDGKGCAKCQAKATRSCTRIAFADIADRIERLRGASNDQRRRAPRGGAKAARAD